MEINKLISMINKVEVETTEDILKKILPLMTKENIYNLCDDISAKEKLDKYNKFRVYKTRLNQGERKEKTLKEVFNLFGYEFLTATWRRT